MNGNKPLIFGLLTKEYSSKTAFLSRIPMQKKYSENLLRDVFLFLVNKAYNIGIELLWHQMFDVTYSYYYSGVNLRFEPFHQYFLKLPEEKKIED